MTDTSMIEMAILLVPTYDDHVRAGLRTLSRQKSKRDDAQLTTISVTISVDSDHSK